MIPVFPQNTEKVHKIIQMKKAAICFTDDGMSIIEKLNNAAKLKGIERFEAYVSKNDHHDKEGFTFMEGSLESWTERMFEEHAAIVFVGSVGIAVRAIAPFVKDKLSDSPVIVIDDLGRFVIPLLSGHVGGADKLAAMIAQLTGATEVITTSTDIHGAFAADVFATENALRIVNREGIKKVSAKAIEGKPITISVKDYPPDGPVDIVIADETDSEYSLLLSPKEYTLGVGMKRGYDRLRAEEFILKVVKDNGLDMDMIYAVCTIDLKQNEDAIRYVCDKYSIPLITFEASVLKKAKGDFASSSFVNETVGVDNVCERAAVLGAGPSGSLCRGKVTGEGITAAIGRRKIH